MPIVSGWGDGTATSYDPPTPPPVVARYSAQVGLQMQRGVIFFCNLDYPDPCSGTGAGVFYAGDNKVIRATQTPAPWDTTGLVAAVQGVSSLLPTQDQVVAGVLARIGAVTAFVNNVRTGVTTRNPAAVVAAVQSEVQSALEAYEVIYPDTDQEPVDPATTQDTSFVGAEAVIRSDGTTEWGYTVDAGDVPGSFGAVDPTEEGALDQFVSLATSARALSALALVDWP